MLRWSPAHLLQQYEWVAAAQWEQARGQIAAVEVGTIRALAQAFGKKRLPDLPDYEQVLAQQRPARERLPEWMRRFEEVNRDRALASE